MAEKKESSGRSCTSNKVRFKVRLDIAGKGNWKLEEYRWREIRVLVSPSLPMGCWKAASYHEPKERIQRDFATYAQEVFRT